MAQSKARRELRLGLAEYDTEGRSIQDARGLFLIAVTALEPRVLQSLRKTPLRVYRELFACQAQQRRSQQQAVWIARTIGFENHIIDEHDAARAELGNDYQPDASGETPVERYPLFRWRDPTPDARQGEKRRLNRTHFGLSIHAYATLENCLPSELWEMERGCLPNAGLTTMSGSEPLRRALLRWARRWHLCDNWCLDWALEQLHTWPPDDPPSYSLDIAGVLTSPTEPPRLPAYRPQLQTRAWYLDSTQKLLEKYCTEVERVMGDAGLKPTPVKRIDQHFEWLARYQIKGESPADIWRSLPQGDNRGRRAVEKAIHDTARAIGLTSRKAK
jgi:hypothetical protein